MICDESITCEPCPGPSMYSSAQVCSIPIGRLQESLSVSHAVTIPLAQIFESRLLALGDGGAEPWLCSAAGEDENKTESSMEE